MLPFATMMDGSTTKTGGRGEAELVFGFHALIDTPIAVDWVKLDKAPTAAKLSEVVRQSFTGGERKYLDVDVFKRFRVISASDHASTMIKLAEIDRTQFSGDPGHATALVMKAIVKEFNIAYELKLIRTVLLRKNANEWTKQLLLFGLNPKLFETPVTRWAYISRLLRVLADTDILARLQQLLLFCLAKGSAEVDADALLECGDGEGDADDDSDEDEALPVSASVKKKRDEARLAKMRLLLSPGRPARAPRSPAWAYRPAPTQGPRRQSPGGAQPTPPGARPQRRPSRC